MAVNRTSKARGKIIDIPGNAPTVGAATDLANGGGATVAFTAPSTDTGGPIFDYVATSTPGSITATGTSSPLTFSGLTVGTSYTFKVAARNASGTGSLSASSNLITPTVPPSSFYSIATVSGNDSAATLTFSGIPATYTHLQLRGIVRTNRASVSTDGIFIYFNSDNSDANYNSHTLDGDGTSASASYTSSGNGVMARITVATASTADTYVVGAVVCDILDYANSNKFKTTRALGGNDRNGAGDVRFASGLWRNTNAITSLTIWNNNNSAFSSLTSFALYGIKGA